MTRAVQLYIICLTTIALSQTSIKATKTDILPVIDGRVEELVWESGAVITDFIQRVPDVGQPMTEKTVIYILYSSQTLYFGMKCYDSEPAKITAKELARDVSLGHEDKIQIIIDTFFDKHNAYWFQINPRGCIGDALVSQNGAAFNKSWDGLWEGKAHITEWGWEGEIAIPFKTMSFRRGQTTWGLKLIRQVTRKSEQGYWPVANLDSHKFQVSDAGHMTGMLGISQGIGLDVVPYGLAGIDRKNESRREYPSEIGFDAFYQITPGLKSALTVNTDFAQTEVDDRRVNLTRFPLFFEEKRDFFLDGANYFHFGIDGEQDHPYQTSIIPFFSRRLGLDDDGNLVPILGGAKLTGQAGRWNLGFLDIVEDRPEGASHAAVGRVSSHLGEQSYIGLIGTARNSNTEMDNTVIGADAKFGTSKFLGNKNISLSVFGLRSTANDSNGTDIAYGSSFFYPNDFIWIASGFHQIGDNFCPGLGFVPRRGVRQIYFRGGLGPRPQKWGILQSISGIHFNRITDLQNQLITREAGVMPLNIEFISGESIAFSFTHVYERLVEDFPIHPEHSIPVGAYRFWRCELEATTARRRPFYIAADIEAGGFFTGTLRTFEAEIGWKIGVPFLVGLDIEHNDVYLDTGDFSTDVVRLNFDVLFGPDIFLVNFLQYDNLSKKLGWQSRFVWILKPGQEVFLVWKSISTDPLEHLEISEYAARLKLKYTIRF
ncbi:hypothetical protein EH223_10510 [candidate division KSB1 bacterium]|nr:carbohydrate binding family 9 domain-containing protein [candidate division KSB1 bacterium]RQW03189.1 MAG: hypothetical protein EH223_10510 [candidate division KSB1 bacterium]